MTPLAASAETLTPATTRRPSWRGSAKHIPLQRSLVLLLIAALLPITVLSILQGMVRIETRRAAVIQQLSGSARALADGNRTILTSTEMLLRVTAMNPIVRGGGPACAALLRDIAQTAPAYANIAYHDADGRQVCAALAPDRPYRIADRQWWANLANSQQALVSDAVWGPVSQRRVMTMAIPLRDEKGIFEGAMIASIDLAWLDARLRARAGDDSTGVAVVSDSGQLLMSSRPLPAFDTATPSGTIARARDGDGAGWSYTVVPLVARAPGQHGLYVAYAAPDPERFGLLWWQTIIDFALPVLAILLASLAIWFGTQRLVLRWLLALQRLALHFAGGDYRRRPVSFAEAPREVRSVAASLYRMSSAVSERDGRLRDSLERQRLLAREVHHRVKNNFQVVMSLLSLQSTRLQDENARRAIDQARRRIGALALVHRLLYETGELGSISSRALLGTLCEQLQPVPQPGRQLALNCDFDDVSLDIDNAVPLTLWMVETVNNAFHHGFPDAVNGVVDCVFRVADGEAMLSVSDNGVGFDPHYPSGDQPGGHASSGGGHGLRLIRALAGQLGGTAEVKPLPEGGSRAALRFPLHAPVGEPEAFQA